MNFIFSIDDFQQDLYKFWI